MVINGEPSDGSGFRNRIYYQNEEGKFTMDTSYPIVPVNQDGGINMGDWDGDGNMDIIDTIPDMASGQSLVGVSVGEAYGNIGITGIAEAVEDENI